MITYITIALNCIISFVGFRDRNFFAKYLFNPYTINRNKKEWYRIFSHAFLHADMGHLFFNMFTFYSFGLLLEQNSFPFLFPGHGDYYYVLLYVGGIIVSAFPGFEKHKNDFGYSAVGASGAVSAVLFSAILIYPTGSLQIMFLPIPIPAVVFGILYLAYTWYMSKRGGDRIAHDAHLWGSLFGFVFTIILKPSLFPEFIEHIKAIF